MRCKKECTSLQPEVLDLKEGRFGEPTRVQGTQFSNNIRKCMMALQGEANVAAKCCPQVVQLVAKYLFNTDIRLNDLPCASTVVNMADEAHVLAKFQISEKIADCKTFVLHLDGTSRDHKKILGHQMTFDSGQNLTVGFMPIAVEDSETLLEAAIGILQERAELTEDVSTEGTEDNFKNLLSKLCTTMSDRASVNKKFNRLLNDYKTETLGTESDINFLFCNAHFLLGLSSEAEKVLKDLEKKMT